MRALVIGLGCLMALSVRAATVSVENIRTWPAPDPTRVVLDVDRPVEYALFVLRDPDRVVVDLRGARLLKGVPKARPGDRLLGRIRARIASVPSAGRATGRGTICGWCST